MLKRIGAAVIALILIGAVAYLGWFSQKNPNFVWAFGIASAFLAPVGLTLLNFSMKGSDAAVIQRLAKVPEIERLINEAKSHEEKIRLLEVEREKLQEIIKLEARRQAISDRVETLENDAIRIGRELDGLDRESAELDVKIGNSGVSDEIARLRSRVRARERGDLVLRLGDRFYRLDRDIVKGLPFGFGNITLAYVKLAQYLLDRMTARTKKS